VTRNLERFTWVEPRISASPRVATILIVVLSAGIVAGLAWFAGASPMAMAGAALGTMPIAVLWLYALVRSKLRPKPDVPGWEREQEPWARDDDDWAGQA
jgi:hypothetical protein